MSVSVGPRAPRTQLEKDLRGAAERDELRLLYQPVVTIGDGSLAAVEALVRWEHPSRGLLAPDEFIPLAEESDLIVELGDWVIHEACRQIKRWRNAHRAKLGVRVSVNISARQLAPALIDTINRALAENEVAPSELALEITESLLIEESESSLEILHAVERLGLAIVLDDFGTGYSSLSYLKRFPLDQLKLDRSFISELAQDPRSAKIVAATIELARAFGMTVVAEGVETPDQLDLLHKLGCDYAQGYHFARPGPESAIFERILGAFELDRQLAEQPPTVAEESAIETAAADAEERINIHNQVVVGRMAMILFTVGSVLAIPADLVMGAPSPLAVVLLTLMGLSSGAVCYFVPWSRISPVWLHVLAVVATVEVTVSVFAIGSHASVLTSFYLLVATVAGYGLRSRRAVAGHVLVIAVAMSLPLLFAERGEVDAASRIMVSFLVLIVTVSVVVWLRERVDAGYAELRILAARDPLTEVGNYRLLHERLEYELLRHGRERRELSVLLIDLDRFKQVNERLGHAAGDDVLRRVAGTLRDSVRRQDTVARQGGDEFAILAPGTDREGAQMLATRIRDRLGRVKFAGHSVSATIGVAVYPRDGVSTQALLARADGQLLSNKLRTRERDPGSPASRVDGATEPRTEPVKPSRALARRPAR
jgi:diguanylate cyclase (GGDEF)-like protein